MPETINSLKGKTVWLTRPQGQAESLASVLEAKGMKVEVMPMLAIEPLAENESIKQRVLDLDHYQSIFFVSTNAARLGMALINNYWPQFPVQINLYTVGPTTAAVLEEYGLRAEYPKTRMSSEALLSLDSLQVMGNTRALIIRGVGGRELLANDLRQRGAHVDYLEIYQRQCPDYIPGELEKKLQDSPDGIVVTSAEALDNLKTLLEKDNCDLSAVHLFVSSDRLADIAAKAGFSDTVTMAGADDKSVIRSLEENC